MAWSRRGPEAALPGGLLEAGALLRDGLAKLRFGPPVTCVYNPLAYAWRAYALYLERYGCCRKRVVFLGMNPGPFGMVQTGVPFGEVEAVRSWLGISAEVGMPAKTHPKRPVLGFACQRSEVSGRRLWGLFAERFGSAAAFGEQHLVLNYCPLAFVEESGRNRTPDKLPSRERAALYALCDAHLRAAVSALQPDWVIGIGDFAAKRAEEALKAAGVKVGRLLHPSPANPAANRGWKEAAAAQLVKIGVWQ